MRILPQPDVPGMVWGIIDTDPLTVQCGECGEIAQRTTERTGEAFILLCGFGFHICEPDSPRRCRECLAAAKAACPLGRCRQ